MADDFRVPFQEAIDFQHQKIPLPSKTWRDITGNAHDRAAVVAGATKQALVEDFAAVIEKIPAGLSQSEFTAEFERLVAKHGWTGWTGEGSEAGRAWRARVIYETNLSTAHAAGRLRQMRNPDVLKRRPYWRYVHAHTRVPEVPRPAHEALDGKVWRADDPIWEKIYPPNDWFCSCGVENLTQEELDEYRAEQRQNGGDPPDGPDAAPELGTRPVFDRGTGQTVQTTKGIGFGWDHAPGRSWADGLIPRELDGPLTRQAELPLRKQPSLSLAAKPFTAPLLPPDLNPEDYVDRFLAEFDASRDRPALHRDAAGHVIAIGEDLFRTGAGRWKIIRPDGRQAHVLRLAEAIRDPDEIWVDWHRGPAGWRLVRRYLRTSPDSPEFASFEWSTEGWSGATAFNPTRKKAERPDPDYLERQRQGALLWKRPEK